MKQLQYVFALSALAFMLPIAASAASVSVVNITPGTSVMVANLFSLDVVPVGLSYASYRLNDSFSGSTASTNNLNGGGHLSWVPSASDVGTHVFTFTATGSEGAVSTSQTITVLPAPSVSISPLTPGTTVMPGTTLTFTAITNGFTNPTFTVGDVSTNPSVQPSNIDATGRFSWTPTLSDNGDHTITVYVSDSLGHHASKSVSVRVGAGPSLAIMLLTPGDRVSPGDTVTFTATPNQYSPTGFSVLDSFPGSTVNNSSMNLSGQFFWVPSASDAGVHTLTVTGVVGAFGDSASTTQTITVLNPDGSTPASAAPVTAQIPTTASPASDPTLSALQAKLAALQSAIVSAQTSGSVSASSVGLFTAYLKFGSNSDEVLRLQQVLSQLGYLSATPNGNFGPATEAAVKLFQKAKGIEQLGVVGPGTRAALNSLSVSAASTPSMTTTSSGTRFVFEHFMGIGDDDATQVLALQQRLTELGYYSGPITGYYGPATEASVKLFQKASGIPETGYVASITRAALNK